MISSTNHAVLAQALLAYLQTFPTFPGPGCPLVLHPPPLFSLTSPFSLLALLFSWEREPWKPEREVILVHTFRNQMLSINLKSSKR